MKVIVAGFSKTGTKSMHAALNQLGYSVYDFLDHEYYHHKEWMEIFTTGGSTELFRKMYENVDAVVARPVFSFWKEIHEAFPEAKIILTTRDETEWVKSFLRQIRRLNGDWMFRFAKTFSPTGYKVTQVIKRESSVSYGGWLPFHWSAQPANETVLRVKYRQHNTDVLQNAPKDKLLVFSVKEGWDPLCKFLGVEVPDVPFPRKNVNSNLLQDAAEKIPIMEKINFEARIVLILLCVFSGALLLSYVLMW